MANVYLKQGSTRNYLLIVMGVHTGLRVSDLLRLRRGDVYDFGRGEFRSHLTLTEQKTGKAKTIALNSRLLSALALCFGGGFGCAEDVLFPNNRKKRAAIGRVQAVLLMDIFNHSSFDVTRRYLGITQDERNSVYLGLALV